MVSEGESDPPDSWVSPMDESGPSIGPGRGPSCGLEDRTSRRIILGLEIRSWNNVPDRAHNSGQLDFTLIAYETEVA